MRSIKLVELQPRLDNSARNTVRDWCKSHLGEDNENWSVRGLYTEHGDFSVIIENSDRDLNFESVIFKFRLSFPDVKIIQMHKETVLEIEEETFSSLFE